MLKIKEYSLRDVVINYAAIMQITVGQPTLSELNLWFKIISGKISFSYHLEHEFIDVPSAAVICGQAQYDVIVITLK